MSFPRQRGLKVYKAQEDFKTLSKMIRKPPRKLNERQKDQVKRLVDRNIEHKFLVTTFPSATIGTQGSAMDIDDGGLGPYSLCLVPQGDTDNTRDGDRIKAKSLSFKIHMFTSDAEDRDFSIHPCVVRFIIFQWKPNSALVAPSPSNILLTDPISTGGASITVYSQYNWDTRQSYNIVYDRTYTLNGDGLINVPAGTAPLIQLISTRTDTSQRHIKGNISFARLAKQLQYNAGSLFGSNHLWFYIIANTTSASPAKNKAAFVFSSRLIYTDA